MPKVCETIKKLAVVLATSILVIASLEEIISPEKVTSSEVLLLQRIFYF